VAPAQRHCEFRFHGVLGAFLAPARRGHAFAHAFDGTPSVKDRIESLGVPHTEVGRLRVDAVDVGFAHRLRGGECIEVFPDVPGSHGGAQALRPPLPSPPRFVLDVHLGRLAGYLRLLGFDALYRNDYRDEELIAVSRLGGRLLLSRDTGLLKQSQVVQGAFLHATDPRRQVRELLDRYQLAPWVRPFSRCACCNGEVVPVARSEVGARVPADVLARDPTFSRCRDCGQVYWPGSHQARLAARLVEVGVRLAPQVAGSGSGSGSGVGSATGEGGAAGTSDGTATASASRASIRASRQPPQR